MTRPESSTSRKAVTSAGFWLLLGLLAGGASGAGAQTPVRPELPPQSEKPRALFSSTRRFLVTGFPAATASELNRWAEEVADRVREHLGPIPMERGWYLEIQAGSSGEVVRAQGWVDGLLQQRLVLGRNDDLDQEDVLESFAWLLLNRWAIVRQSVDRRSEKLATVPDWLAFGLAQHLYPALRARNAVTVQERWRNGELTPWENLTGREVLPPGRWVAKAESALLVSWILDRKTSLDPVWNRCASHLPLDPEWLAREFLRMEDPRKVTVDWELWMATRQERHYAVSILDLNQVRELEALTRFDVVDLSGVGAGVAPPLSLADLIGQRKESWVPRLAHRRALQIQLAMLNRSEEWQAAARRLIDFLEALSGRGSGYTGGWLKRGPSARQLRILLKEAEDALAGLASMVEARTAYLDRLEAGWTETKAMDDAAWMDAVRAYLDTLEEREAAPVEQEMP